MAKYRLNYTKTVQGSFLVEAENKEEAEKKIFEENEGDEQDNKCDYVYDQDEQGNADIYLDE